MKANKAKTKAPKMGAPAAKAPAVKGGKPGKTSGFNRFPPDKKTGGGNAPAY